MTEKSGWKPGLLAHEWCFGGYLLVAALRLLAGSEQAQPWSVLFVSFLLLCCGVIAWARQEPSPIRWRIRLLIFPVTMGVCFFAMGKALPLLGVNRDECLVNWDRYLLGETPSALWAAWRWPWLVDLSMGGYLFFFIYLVAGPGLYFFRRLQLFRSCIVGLFVVYGLGFVGYVLVPAGGPHRFLVFDRPLEGIWLLPATLSLVNEGSNKVDAFPSIHLGATLFLLLFDWEHARRRFWWVLGPCLILWFSTLYLRFHYFVDLMAGVVVAGIGWHFARRDARSEEPTEPTTQGISMAR